MAKPRVFVSSTFYDLRHVRSDLEMFIKDVGCEPVLHERGSIPYGKEEALEEYCYREIELCDIIVSIIGGRYGSESEEVPYSVSQMELKRASDAGKQVYIFVDRNVLSEYSTYLENKQNKDVKYRYVDNIAVYKFLEEIYGLPKNNPVTPFETSQDITLYLKTQWAGLFQRLLMEETRREEVRLIKDLTRSAETLNKLVTYLTEEKKGSDEAIKTILLASHPVFDPIKKNLRIQYRIYFTNLEELNELLKARRYEPVNEEFWDEPSYREWLKIIGNNRYLFKVANEIFDDNGKLKIMTKDDWDDDYIKLEISPVEDDEAQVSDF